jgi:hypothetical protein
VLADEILLRKAAVASRALMTKLTKCHEREGLTTLPSIKGLALNDGLTIQMAAESSAGVDRVFAG